MSHRIAQRLLVAGLLAAFLVALPRCRPPAPAPEATTALPREEIGAAETSTPATAGAPVTLPASPTPAPSPTPVAAIPTSSPIPSPIPLPTPAVRVACGPDLPARVADLLRAWAAEEKVAVVGEEGGSAGLSWDLQPGPDGRLFNERIYVPVQRFATLREEITLDELRGMWESASGAASGSASGATSGGPRLLVTEETAAELALLWGWPQAGSQPSVDLVADDELTDALWADEQAVGLVPFERLEPRLKPLRIGTLSVVDNRLQQPDWPLAVRVWLHGWEEGATGLPPYPGESNLPASNRDPAKLTVLVMTGVTAMSRTTAWKMEVYEDYAYPAHVIGTELAAADITHISNEVPFVQGCVASPTLNLLTLCSKPEYMAALDEVGVDIVGLTGNHQNDFGREAALDSLKIYADRALPVYGGGPNDEKARAPLFGTDHGNRLAFLGANSHGPEAAWATVDGPGSARFDLETMQADIAAVRSQVDLVLVEIQYTETNGAGEYQTEPVWQQQETFQAISAAGAGIVTGVQAHRPQALEFTDNGLILYGLGNLFFDQMNWWETRQGLIARHAIYDGRHISTELLVTVLEDWAQPRWATPEEREMILAPVFAASGW